jgi:type I restriction enzyme S subunit
MEKLNNIPFLRFPEFEGEWELKKVGEMSIVCAGATPSTTKKEYWGGTVRWMNSGELNLKKVYEVENRITDLGLNKSSTKLIPKHSILIGLAGQGKTRGTVAMNMVELCTNQSIGSILPNESYFSEFMYHNLDNRYEELRALSTGDGGRGGLNLQIIKSLPVKLPTIPEQTKIASFHNAIDNKLQALKQKKKLLNQYKKGVMQKIFSQELRFKDDNGNNYPAWVEKKLGEVLVKNSKKNKNQEFKLVQSVSNKRGFVNQDEYFEDRIIASKDLSNYYVIQKGDFAYNPSRIDVGSLAYKFDNNTSVISPLYISFKTVGVSLVDAFLLEWFTTQQFTRQMNSSFEGSVRNTLSYESLRKIEIAFPSLEEQNKIANFLSAIDDKINHCQAQIEKTEVWKKGLLQQMFV